MKTAPRFAVHEVARHLDGDDVRPGGGRVDTGGDGVFIAKPVYEAADAYRPDEDLLLGAARP